MVLLCAAAALLALPAGAGAKPGYVVKPKSLALHFDAPASNGYSVSVDTEGHRKVTVSVSKGGFFATYTATGRVSRKGIKADLGRFGQISLRFHGKTRFQRSLVPGLNIPDPLRGRCSGRSPVRERGIFHGSFRFEGERGFTEAALRRVKGTARRTYKRICKRRGDASGSKAKTREENVFVRAEAQRFGTLRFFNGLEASVTDEKGREENFTIAFAGLQEKTDRVGVLKVLILFEDLDTVTISPRGKGPTTAQVTLRSPFAGTASYLEEGKAPPTWSGTLGLRVPGHGLVPLTGPEFEADVCRARTSPEFDRCIESIFVATTSQGSGSHSQPLALARLSSLR